MRFGSGAGFGSGGVIGLSEELEFFARRSLVRTKKCLRVFPLAAEFERAEIFEPGSFRDIWSFLQPNSETNSGRRG